MKTTFFILVLVLFTFSCKSDDDVGENNQATLNGSWSLVNVLGGFAGVDDDFERGLIKWKFNENQQKITVTNNSSDDVIYSGYPSGIYNYEVIVTESDTTLVIENNNLKIKTLTATQLVIDEGMISDGFQYTFSR